MSEINTQDNTICVLSEMPEPRWAHAAVMVGSTLLITGGLDSIDVNMGLRSIPEGKKTCLAMETIMREGQPPEYRWRTDLPEIPHGRVWPHLVCINNNIVYQVGGYEDCHFELYKLDLAQWHRDLKDEADFQRGFQEGIQMEVDTDLQATRRQERLAEWVTI